VSYQLLNTDTQENKMKKRLNFVVEGHHGPLVTDVLYSEDEHVKPVVIVVHGFKGYKDWGTFPLVAEQLAEAGFVCVKFNFSHNGGTVEQPIDFPDLEAFGHNNYSKEQDDLATIIDWIEHAKQLPKTADRSNISLIGHSRGGAAVILKAGQDKRVKKLVSWAAVSDFGARWDGTDIARWKEKGVLYSINGRTKQNMPMYFQIYEDFKANEEQLTISKAAKKIDIPWLICHGTEDAAVDVQEARNLKSWQPDAELFLVEGAGHTFDGAHPWREEELPGNLEKVVRRTVGFLRR
jgi:dienelactone hydrolase